MELDKMTQKELYQLRDKVNRELEVIFNREKKIVYEIATSDDLSWAFKKKKDALKSIIEMAQKEDDLFCEDEKVIIRTTYIDKAEYDKNGDSWLWT